LLSGGFPWNVVQGLSLATIWTEAEIIRDRQNAYLTMEAILIHSAIADVVGGGGHLSRVLEDIRDG